MRGWLPLVSLAVTALGLVFTLSRGAMVSLLVVGVVLLVGFRRMVRARRGLVLATVLGILILGGTAWIGIEPIVARLRSASVDAGYRWAQAVTSLPLIAGFPALGVGLGAYGDIYFRYQPALLKPGKLRYMYAHNDLLQFVTEVGVIGAGIGLFAVWRAGRDLVGVHLLGRGACPVAAARGDEARRRDPFSVGLGVGGLTAALTLFVHSAFDFAARIPANGILAAACLGIATVALHTRFGAGAGRFIERVRVLDLGGPARAVVAGGALAMAVVSVPVLVRPALVEGALDRAKGPQALARADEAVGHDPTDVPALRARARLRMEAASALNVDGSPDPAGARRRDVQGFVDGAIGDLAAAIRRAPTDPYLHERLGWAYAFAAQLDGGPASEPFRSALTHFRRAILLAPENPYLRKALADFALGQPHPMLDIGLPAAREAIRRDAELLPHEVDRFIWLGLPSTQWKSLVPDTALDRLRLAAVLEDRGRFREADTMYPGAVAAAAPPDEALARWMYARFLLATEKLEGARAEAEAGLRRDPDNPELHLTRAHALAAAGDAGALGAHEAALRSAQARRGTAVFPHTEPMLRALMAARIGTEAPTVTPLRYRRALVRYLTDRGFWEDLLREVEQVARESPLDAADTFSLGLALDGIGARDRAVQAYRNALALEPQRARVRHRLAQALWDGGQFVQAIDEWRRITAEESTNVDARLALARAYARMGALSDAAREYQAVLRIAGDHREARDGLARLGRNR